MARRIRCTSLKEMAGLCNGRCRDEAACVITRYFAKVQSMNSAKYYVGIGLRLLLWLQDVCGNRAGGGSEPYFTKAGFEQRPAE